jgi:Zn-dependent peptidase ImmA (M78 family)
MNLDKITFGSRIINLNLIDKEKAKDKKIFGEFDSDQNTITLDKSLDDIQMSNTLIHEICHLIHDEYKLDLPAKAEELICNSIANGICHTLYQNQDLLDFLYKSLKKD